MLKINKVYFIFLLYFFFIFLLLFHMSLVLLS